MYVLISRPCTHGKCTYFTIFDPCAKLNKCAIIRVEIQRILRKAHLLLHSNYKSLTFLTKLHLSRNGNVIKKSGGLQIV